MTEVFKDFTFEAAHSLPHLPETHKCRNLHGHSYSVTVCARGEVNADGMVIDYADLSAAWEPLFLRLDHHFINEIEGLEISTSEHLARWIYDHLKKSVPQLYSITVRESPTAGSTYAEEVR